MGVELEIDKGGKDTDNARMLSDIANASGEHIYIKHDGSLINGLEIVTHPMSIDYHINEMPWLEIVSLAKELGYYSHETETCGLHGHINRNSFGEDYTIQDECIGRILYIVEKFWNKLLRFSRRTPRKFHRM